MNAARIALVLALFWAGPAFGLDSASVTAPPRPTPEATPTPVAEALPSGSPQPTPAAATSTPIPTPDGAPPTQSEGPERPRPEGSFEPEITGGLAGRFIRIPKESDAVERGMSPIDPIDTAEMPGAILRGLDKMTGRIVTIEIAAGERRGVERLLVQLFACRSPEGGDISGTMAFLKIWDTRGGEEVEVFSGWMFAASPALSAMDHPRYDLWLINCITS